MKDVHGLSGTDAVRDDRNKKLERWLQNSNDATPQKKCVEIDDTSSSMQTVEEVDPNPAPSYRLLCESCGTEAFLPVDLAAQGLTFQCAMIGRACSFTNTTANNGFRNFASSRLPASASGQVPVDMAVPSDDEDL